MQNLTYSEWLDTEPERPIAPSADETGGELSAEEFDEVLDEQRREAAQAAPAWANMPDAEPELD